MDKKELDMTRKQFEEALLPLTSAEKTYKINPVLDYNSYQQFPKAPARFNLLACNIFPDQFEFNHLHSSLFAFNRNDRFIEVPVHNHGYIELNYVFTGSCTAIVNGQSLQLTTGDICIMDREASHTILPTKEDDIVLNILMSSEFFSYSFLSNLLIDGPVSKFLLNILTENNEHNQYLLFRTTESHHVKELIENMIIEYLTPGICSESVIKFSLSLLFIELARCYQGQLEREHQQKSKTFLTEILEYVESHCLTCSLVAVAKQFNFSPNYLSRLLKQETGHNFQNIVTESRLNRIAFLLKTTSRPISVIANEGGYQNQSFFRQKFMERYGMTPKAYRES